MKPSDKIIFLGDSITEYGDAPEGYVSIIRDELKEKHGTEAPQVINAGISGNKVADLQLRLDKDVLSRKPTMVVVYIGINDVWHFALDGHEGTPRHLYESGLIEVVSRIKSTGARVILCTPGVIGEKGNGENPQDEVLDDYSEVTRSVAKSMRVELCDLRLHFKEHLRKSNRKNLSEGVLTIDGVHLNPEGNRLVAAELLSMLRK